MAPEIPDSETGGRTAAGLRLVLCAAAGPHPLGEPVPVHVELRNVSDTGLWVVGVLDGSEAGLRYPHYRTAILRDGRPTDQPGPEDPLVGPLLRSHFRRLAPGEAFAPGQAVEGGVSFPLTAFDHFSPSETGDYEYRLTFSTESARPEQWFGRFGQRAEERGLLLDLISRVPRCTMTASVTVTVR